MGKKITEKKNKSEEKEKSQFGLLRTRRFAPFFWTQFFGAFNDNVFKNSLVLFIAFKMGQALAAQSDMLINLAAGLLILPFFLFSATAGQIADKYEKSLLIRYIKIAEIIIMIFAGIAFYFSSIIALMVLIFLMGTQSAFFGPVKYSILPQHLKGKEIVGGNAMVEMGTFVAILIGTIAGGFFTQVAHGELWVGVALVAFAVTGWLSSRGIPEAAADSPDLKINYNPVTQTIKTIKISRERRSVYLSILGISWFWALGLAYLSQLPNYTRTILHGSEEVVTLLLTMFSAGIGTASLLCERLSGKKVELGLVPIGSIGLSIFGIDLIFANPVVTSQGLMGIAQFIQLPGSVRVLVDLAMIGVFGGIFIVPLYSLIQVRTRAEVRSRVIAANNIMNALFMVAASVIAMLLLGVMNLSIPRFFMIVALANIVVAGYIYSLVPEFLFRFLMWLLSKIMYRVKRYNLDIIPEEGAAVIISNHVTFVDSLFIAGSIQRKICFVMDVSYFRMPLLGYIAKKSGVIPIASKNADPEVYKKAFDDISEALNNGELVCIFPEGKLTGTGEIEEFRPGVEKILKRDPVPVIPLALRGLWGSFFSRKYGPAMTHISGRFKSKIEIIAGNPIEPEKATVDSLFKIVSDLRGEYA